MKIQSSVVSSRFSPASKKPEPDSSVSLPADEVVFSEKRPSTLRGAVWGAAGVFLGSGVGTMAGTVTVHTLGLPDWTIPLSCLGGAVSLGTFAAIQGS